MNSFTPAERLETLAILLKIYRDESLKPVVADAHLVRDLLKKLLQNGAVLRNDFGLNKIVIALESVYLATQEIGLRGFAFYPYIIYSLIQNKQHLNCIYEDCSVEIRKTLEVLLRVSQLEAKEEAMRTDNFRNLFVSQAGDMRIVLLLIAQSVVLMRRIKDTPNIEAQRRLSVKAASLYAPLALSLIHI